MQKTLRATTCGAALLGLAGCATTGNLGGLTGFSISGQSGPQITQVADRASATDGTDAALNAGAEVLGQSQSYLYRGEYLNARLDEFLEQEILAHWPHERPENIGILVKMSAVENYNASAHPDNTIVVNLGVLEKLETDDELAYLLAHEFAHIVLGHSRRITGQIQNNQVSNTMATLYNVGAVLSQTEFDTSGSGETFQIHTDTDIGAVSRARKQANDGIVTLRYINDVVGTPAYSRNQEDEADAIAADLLVRAGFSMDAGKTFFSRFEGGMNWRERAQQKSLAALTSSLESTLSAESLMASLGEDANVIDQAWKDVRGSMARAGRDWLAEQLSQSHRSAEARSNGIDRYLLAAYGEAVPVGEERYDLLTALYEPMAPGTPACDFQYMREARDVVFAARNWDATTGVDLDAPVEEARPSSFAEAINQSASSIASSYQASLMASMGATTAQSDAGEQITGPTPAQIAAEAQAAAEAEAERQVSYAFLAGYMSTGVAPDVVDESQPGCPSRSNPVSRSTFYQTAMAQFAPTDEDALRHYTRAVNGDYPEARTFAEKASLEIDMGRVSAAEQTLSLGAARFGDEYYFLPERIRISSARGEMAEAAGLFNTCRATERLELEERCTAVVHGIDLASLTEEQRAAFGEDIARDADTSTSRAEGIQQGVSDLGDNVSEGIRNLFGGNDSDD